MQKIMERASKIKLVVFDVDGVLTDGSLYIDDHGQEYKAFNSRDGYGMQMLLSSGIEIAIITGRTSDVVKLRMESLGIKYIYQGKQEKLPVFEELRDRLGLTSEQTAYVGDDIVDLPILIRVGLAVAVQDAHTLVRQHSHWITPNPGGHAAARDVCELIMQAQGTLDSALDRHLR